MFKKKAPPAKNAQATKSAGDAKPAAAKPPGDAKAAAPAPAKKGGLKLPFGKKKATAAAPAKPSDAPASKPPAAAGAGGAAPAAKPAGAPPKAPAKTKEGGSPFKLILGLLLLVGLGAGAYFAYSKFAAPSTGTQTTNAPAQAIPASDAVDDATTLTQSKTKKKANAAAAPDAQAANAAAADPNAAPANAGAAANAASCAGTPKFIAKLGFGTNAYFDTSETHRLILLAPVPDSDAVSKYQNQSWNQFGYVGAYALDRKGNIYLAPSPRLGPGVKAAKSQNVIYKVDTNTGELSKYTELPDASAPTPDNPYGILGLTYDCTTNSLYASTIAGSTAAKENGHIFRIDLNLGAVAGRLDNTDAAGLVTSTDAKGQVLYFGSARTPTLRAINLDAQGNPQGQARDVGTLTGNQRALRLTLESPSTMIVQAVDFGYANADIPQGQDVRFQYDPASDKWNAAQ